MKIMLDCSPAKIAEYSKRYDYEFWQLRTPLTTYRLAGVPYGLDNGCFSGFQEQNWNRLIREAEDDRPLFITVPDVVGSMVRTLDLFHIFKRKLNGMAKCLVLQDGVGNTQLPWDDLSGVFIGGSDQFKISKECMQACQVAGLLKKHIHLGRVNSAQRIQDYLHAAGEYGFQIDSIDGSGMSRFDQRLENVLAAIRNDDCQHKLFAGEQK